MKQLEPTLNFNLEVRLNSLHDMYIEFGAALWFMSSKGNTKSIIEDFREKFWKFGQIITTIRKEATDIYHVNCYLECERTEEINEFLHGCNLTYVYPFGIDPDFYCRY